MWLSGRDQSMWEVLGLIPSIVNQLKKIFLKAALFPGVLSCKTSIKSGLGL